MQSIEKCNIKLYSSHASVIRADYSPTTTPQRALFTVHWSEILCSHFAIHKKTAQAVTVLRTKQNVLLTQVGQVLFLRESTTETKSQLAPKTGEPVKHFYSLLVDVLDTHVIQIVSCVLVGKR